MKPAAAKLLPPVPYGATRYEVQREATAGTAAHRVATFDRLDDAQQYVKACNAYPRLVAALHEQVAAFGAKHSDETDSPRIAQIRALLRELGEI